MTRRQALQACAPADPVQEARARWEALSEEEPRARHRRAMEWIAQFREHPDVGGLAGLALAALGDASEIPRADRDSLLERCRRSSRPEGRLDAVVAVALKGPTPREIPDLLERAVEMLDALSFDGSRPMETAYAGVRMLSHLVARYGPEKAAGARPETVRFLASPLPGLLEDVQSVALAQAMAKTCRESLVGLARLIRDRAQLERMQRAARGERSGEGAIEQEPQRVRIGEVFLPVYG